MRDKRERFVSLAEARTDKAITALRSLSKLGNRRNYEYSDRDVRKILKALDGEMKALRAAFSESAQEGTRFRLDP